MPYVSGHNDCGYMPDAEPSEYEDFDSAKGNTLQDMDLFLQDLGDPDGITDPDEREMHGTKIYDLRNAIGWVEDQTGPFSITVNGHAHWVTAR